MLVDITLKVMPEMVRDAMGNGKTAVNGHIGTHFDVMNKEFPLEYTRRNGIVFDVNSVENREITSNDVDLALIKPAMFVGFYTGFIERVTYGTKEYYDNQPQLSNELIDKLLDMKISIIGIDFAGVRAGKEHTPKDQFCADRNVFIVENLCNLKSLLGKNTSVNFVANTYPMNFASMSGLPCRVIAEV